MKRCKITFVLGGARSGKSRFALTRAGSRGIRYFIATAQAIDREMRDRIAAHRAARPAGFLTIAEATDIAGAMRKLPAGCKVAVVDCLTVWLANLMHEHGIRKSEYLEVKAFMESLKRPPCDLVLVSNEVGLGIVPAGRLGRAFRDVAGRLNQDIASVADEVIFMVSGLPMTLKKGRKK